MRLLTDSRGIFPGPCSASPELGINTASAIMGVSEYWPRRVARLEYHRDSRRRGGVILRRPPTRYPGTPVPVSPEVVTVHAFPYLGILALFALITVPPAWRGLQPIDGGILIVAYLAYLAQALVRGGASVRRSRAGGRSPGLPWPASARRLQGHSSWFFSTERLVAGLGIPQMVGGFSSRRPLRRYPRPSPPAASPVRPDDHGGHHCHRRYAGFIWSGRGFRRWQIFVFAAAYLACAAAIVVWLQPRTQGYSENPLRQRAAIGVTQPSCLADGHAD